MYPIQTFIIPSLHGISQINIEEHLNLYKGYVTNTNKILELIEAGDLDTYVAAEVHRRLSFEFNGMKNHEYYFAQIEGGAQVLGTESPLARKIANQWGSVGEWIVAFKQLAKTRGIGWAILGYDSEEDHLVNYWVDEQHLGHLNSVKFIFGMDMWEHAFVADYQPSGKGQYIDDYISQVNWVVVSERYES
jgi:Fe-Mn family superoxide dismutase